ncbi:TIGR02647 family protein [Balneatrix alpica]|uniref:TIGR02647 family protein n=1 Tax=Balneatrix alpica TaxID=75684 RepID=A0ABV5ZA18_9GAMM|nr:TIGR02647 family protein [Balneatrix alpica]
MPLSSELVDEIRILAQYRLDSDHVGLKVHHDAEPALINATQRLFEKGLISQADGGYLTDLGRDAAEHAQDLLFILRSK